MEPDIVRRIYEKGLHHNHHKNLSDSQDDDQMLF